MLVKLLDCDGLFLKAVELPPSVPPARAITSGPWVYVRQGNTDVFRCVPTFHMAEPDGVTRGYLVGEFSGVEGPDNLPPARG